MPSVLQAASSILATMHVDCRGLDSPQPESLNL
jgi:hypothetical protein